MADLVLASSSPRRRELLEKIGLTCEVIPASIDERALSGESPCEHVLRLAQAKAEKVASNVGPKWVIAADTAVVLGEHILGKPHQAEDARSMLSRLSNREHRVITGFCVLKEGAERHLEAVESSVRFKRLTSEEIDRYIETGEPFDKAGAYAVQELGSFMVKAVEGSFTNVVGLPLCEVLEALRELGIVDPETVRRGRELEIVSKDVGSVPAGKRDFFDRLARGWESVHYAPEQKDKVSLLVKRFGLNQGDRVLDVATGTGILLPLITQAIGPGGLLVAVDFSRKMLTEAGSKASPLGAFLLQAKVETLPLASDSFTSVICFAAFPHFPHHGAALKEMRRVLHPGGKLFIAHLEGSESLNRYHAQVGGPVAHDHLPSGQSMARMLSLSGYTDIENIDEPEMYLAQATKG
jgi:septum formation protein